MSLRLTMRTNEHGGSKARTALGIIIIFAIIAVGVGKAAMVLDGTNIYGASWLNATSLDVENIFIDGTQIDVTYLPGATVYVGFNEERAQYANYFYCTGSSDGAQLQAAADYADTNGGGIYYVELGKYDIDDQNLNITTKNPLTIRGEASIENEWAPDGPESSGSVFVFTAPYGFVDKNDATTVYGYLDIEKMGLYFTGNYSAGGLAWYMKQHFICIYDTRINVNAIIPYSGTAINLGDVGMPAEPVVHEGVQYIDERLGGTYSTYMRIFGENIIIRNSGMIANFAASMTNVARFIRLNPVTNVHVSDFQIYTGSDWDTGGYKYESMWYDADNADALWYFDTSQFLDPTDVAQGHLRTDNGDVFVWLNNPLWPEGGYADTINLTPSSNGGTVYIQGTGHGYEWKDTVEASNADWIEFPFPFAGTPHVYLTVEESDAAYSAQVQSTNTTHFQLYLYDIVAAGAESVDKTVTYIAYFEESG